MTTDRIAVIDLETTGLSPWRHDRVVEIAIVVISPDGTVQEEYETLVNPKRDLGPSRIHQILCVRCAGPRRRPEEPDFWRAHVTDENDGEPWRWLGVFVSWPYGSEFAKGEPSGQWNINTRHQRFQLDDLTDIQLTAIWAPGELSIPAVLSTPMSGSAQSE